MVAILLATHNAGKVREIRRLAMGHPWHWHSLDDFADVPPAVEDAETFAENARRKALHYNAATGLPTLADDSGLEVDCLGGAPGVHSARYAGEGASDKDLMRVLLAKLEGVPLEERQARFRCVIAVAWPSGRVETVEGTREGVIAQEPRGDNGFGYDPVFYLPDYHRTMAEIPMGQKNRISHRAEAARKAVTLLHELAEGRKV